MKSIHVFCGRNGAVCDGILRIMMEFDIAKIEKMSQFAMESWIINIRNIDSLCDGFSIAGIEMKNSICDSIADCLLYNP